MTDTTIDVIAERLLHEAAEAITTPGTGECLHCFVARMLDAFGCDSTLRFALRYRDRVAPRATALEGRLAAVGGCCDCEIFLHGWWIHPRFWASDVDPGAPPTLPPCTGVRRGSVRPCGSWARRVGEVW